MKALAIIFILLVTSSCQMAHVSVTSFDVTKTDPVEIINFNCNNFGDTEFQIDYKDIIITCYGGKLSDQAANLVTDIFSAVVKALVPVSAISSGFNSLFGGEEE